MLWFLNWVIRYRILEHYNHSPIRIISPSERLVFLCLIVLSTRSFLRRSIFFLPVKKFSNWIWWVGPLYFCLVLLSIWSFMPTGIFLRLLIPRKAILVYFSFLCLAFSILHISCVSKVLMILLFFLFLDCFKRSIYCLWVLFLYRWFFHQCTAFVFYVRVYINFFVLSPWD